MRLRLTSRIFVLFDVSWNCRLEVDPLISIRIMASTPYVRKEKGVWPVEVYRVVQYDHRTKGS